ncbi:leucine-rich repeat-containing protein 70-like [Drosophila rhopaloa]|uniref:Leucine-rich repeat-containing protein 15 n=1 Tax=Drosophila rhopaloa TaxID=1041015 RepID=A0ABM5GUF3_DRORH|nr:leucine-rich repeat-containing protein 70-like [Drosophila rhopaloa]
MDSFPYLLLVAAVAVMATTESEHPCEGYNCTSTEISTYNDDLLELALDSCSNLGVLKGSPKLEMLMINNCSSGDLHNLPSLPKLCYLRIRNGNITELSDEQFAMMTILDTVELGNNSISRVSIEAFKGLSHVWRLGLQDNDLTILPDGVFHSLPELVDLNLNRNKLATLEFKTFSKNPKMKYLWLRDNPLTMVLAIPLKQLIRLDLANCRPLEELQMHTAETVILSNSGVRKLDVVGSVSKLYARKNRLRYLQLDDKMSIIELDLSDNMMQTKELHKILLGMWRLQRLDLSCNLMNELPVPNSGNSDEVFFLPNLRFVNLSSNMLEYLHGDSPLMSPALYYLDLSHNKIRILDPHIFKMVNNLQYLHIEWNQIREFRYDSLYKQQRGLKLVILFNNLFSNETYVTMTKFFKDSGVRVIERTQDQPEVSYTTVSSMDNYELSLPDEVPMEVKAQLIQTSEPTPQKKKLDGPPHKEPKVQDTIQKWTLFDYLIFIVLLAALTLNVFLIVQLRRSQNCLTLLSRFWESKGFSKMQAKFVSMEDPEV